MFLHHFLFKISFIIIPLFTFIPFRRNFHIYHAFYEICLGNQLFTDNNDASFCYLYSENLLSIYYTIENYKMLHKFKKNSNLTLNFCQCCLFLTVKPELVKFRFHLQPQPVFFPERIVDTVYFFPAGANPLWLPLKIFHQASCPHHFCRQFDQEHTEYLRNQNKPVHIMKPDRLYFPVQVLHRFVQRRSLLRFLQFSVHAD